MPIRPDELQDGPGPDEEAVENFLEREVKDLLESNKGYFYTEEEITNELAEEWNLGNLPETPNLIANELIYNHLGTKIGDMLSELVSHNQIKKIDEEGVEDHYGIEQ